MACEHWTLCTDADCPHVQTRCAACKEIFRLRAALETAGIEAQREIAAGAIAHAGTIAALETAERVRDILLDNWPTAKDGSVRVRDDLVRQAERDDKGADDGAG